MKRLTITVLVAGLFAGSLFASENNTMMSMDKEKCMAMHKSMHQEMNKNNSGQESSSVYKKHQEILNPDRSESQLYEG
jgi:Ni/Co efflux regulator RcnB